MTEALAGVVLGAVSSGHCVLMCGPLMLLWRQRTARASDLLLYHAARVSAYAALGALAGGVGRAVSFGGFAGAVSIAAGLALIAMALGGVGIGRGALGRHAGRHVGGWLVRSRAALAAHARLGALVSGGLNALIPCGMLYAALGVAAATGGPNTGAVTMGAYGLGTLPLLVATWWTAGPLGNVARRRWRLVAPLTLALTGLLLVSRGIVDHQHVTSTAASTAGGHQHVH